MVGDNTCKLLPQGSMYCLMSLGFVLRTTGLGRFWWILFLSLPIGEQGAGLERDRTAWSQQRFLNSHRCLASQHFWSFMATRSRKHYCSFAHVFVMSLKPILLVCIKPLKETWEIPSAFDQNKLTKKANME